MRQTHFFWLWPLLAVFVFASCRKDSVSDSGSNNNGNNNNNNGQNQTPQPTPVGTPVGTAMQTVIGTNGGTFATPDGRLLLEFPAGALSNETTITVQPVTNHCMASSGNAWLITPHNITFNKPVKLTFAYGDSDMVNTTAMALTIAYQDANGLWQAAGNMVKDTLNRKVSVLTNHFSSWSLFRAIELTPHTTVVEPGAAVQLVVDRYVDFANDSLLPVPLPLTKKENFVKEWNLAGAGSLASNGNLATYTAPGAIPSRNPVAVSATLKTIGSWQFTLVSNIYIGKEGLTFRIDNGPWMHGPSLGAYFNGYNNQFTAPNMYTPGHDGVTITWMGDSHIIDFVPWKITYPGFIYGPDPNTTYLQILSPSGSPSPGGIYFHQAVKTAATPYVIGAFYLQPAQKIVLNPGGIPQYSHHRIEGFFKVKWQ